MSDLVVIGFEDKFTAEALRTKLIKMQDEYLVDLENAAVGTAAGAISGSLTYCLWNVTFMIDSAIIYIMTGR